MWFYDAEFLGPPCKEPSRIFEGSLQKPAELFRGLALLSVTTAEVLAPGGEAPEREGGSRKHQNPLEWCYYVLWHFILYN